MPVTCRRCGEGWAIAALVVIVSATLTAPRSAWGQAPDSAGAVGAVELELRSLLDRARAENPEILAAQARLEGSLERPIQERTLPDPTIGVRYHNETFSDFTIGEREMSFAALSAEQEVPFPGKLGLRGAIAEREAERERALRDATVLDVLARVAVAYFDLGVVDRSSEILRESLGAVNVIVQQAGTRYAVGAASQQDVLRSSLERGTIVERLTILESRRAAAQASLNALLDRAPNEPFRGTASQGELNGQEPLEDLLRRLDAASPELRAAEEDLLRSESTLALARREYYPDMAFVGEYTNKANLDPEWELGIRLKVPLYFWRRQAPAVREQVFARHAAERSQRNVRVTLQSRLRELHALATAAGDLVRLYRTTLIPQASLTLESALASYQVGQVDLLTTLNAFTSLLEFRIREAEETGNYSRARAQLRPLLGESPLGERVTGP
jgi:outer membrane protein TolC